MDLGDDYQEVGLLLGPWCVKYGLQGFSWTRSVFHVIVNTNNRVFVEFSNFQSSVSPIFSFDHSRKPPAAVGVRAQCS